MQKKIVKAIGCAMRGRDAGGGIPWTQRLELRKDEFSNSISTVQKDSLVLIVIKKRNK